MITIAAALCATFISAPDLDSTTQSLSNEGQLAYARLLKAERFAYAGVGYAGTLPKEVLAVRTLLGERNAKPALLMLLKEATAEGQLFALSALYLVDQQTFELQVKKFITTNADVRVQSGCRSYTQKARELVRRSGDNVVRLPPGTTLAQWSQAHPKLARSGYRLDIAGGGIPAKLAGPN